jgi:RNA 2',3'-cyclic 3'-phosphodiesterase
MNDSLTVKKKTIRVFFAIKPDDAALKRLAHLTKQLKSTCNGKYIKKANIHLTLVFLGEIAIDQLNLIRSAMNRITAPAFNFSVDKIGYWKPNKIIFARPNKCVPELLALVTNIQSMLSAIGFAYDSRTYKPHITLARKAKPIQVITALAPPISWLVTEWFLIQSKQTDLGMNYIPLDRWQLSHFSS